MEEDLIQQSLDDYDAGKYSPRLLTAHELPLDAHVLEPDEDQQRLQLSRQQLQATGDPEPLGGPRPRPAPAPPPPRPPPVSEHGLPGGRARSRRSGHGRGG